MRKTLISLLLAGAFVPAAAFGQDEDTGRDSRSQAEHVERASQRADAKAERAQRSENVQRERVVGQQRAQQMDGIDRQAGRSPRIDRSTDQERVIRPNRMQDSDGPTRAERPARPDRTQLDPQPVKEVQAPPVVQPVTQSDDKPDNLVDAFRQYRPGDWKDQGKDHDHDGDWSHDWRKDKRYDWWHYRSRHRSLFRLGHYYDPYGWGYRRWSTGYDLWPSYYGSNFWLNDPWMYRLPPAYGPYRWVRYYDDALLVDIYSGRVVDVIYNFFW